MFLVRYTREIFGARDGRYRSYYPPSSQVEPIQPPRYFRRWQRSSSLRYVEVSLESDAPWLKAP